MGTIMGGQPTGNSSTDKDVWRGTLPGCVDDMYKLPPLVIVPVPKKLKTLGRTGLDSSWRCHVTGKNNSQGKAIHRQSSTPLINDRLCPCLLVHHSQNSAISTLAPRAARSCDADGSRSRYIPALMVSASPGPGQSGALRGVPPHAPPPSIPKKSKAGSILEMISVTSPVASLTSLLRPLVFSSLPFSHSVLL